MSSPEIYHHAFKFDSIDEKRDMTQMAKPYIHKVGRFVDKPEALRLLEYVRRDEMGFGTDKTRTQVLDLVFEIVSTPAANERNMLNWSEIFPDPK